MVVMPGLDPGIHVLLARESEYVDGRVKPGHDERWIDILGSMLRITPE
jgi:hypothetical protein